MNTHHTDYTVRHGSLGISEFVNYDFCWSDDVSVAVAVAVAVAVSVAVAVILFLTENQQQYKDMNAETARISCK